MSRGDRGADPHGLSECGQPHGRGQFQERNGATGSNAAVRTHSEAPLGSAVGRMAEPWQVAGRRQGSGQGAVQVSAGKEGSWGSGGGTLRFVFNVAKLGCIYGPRSPLERQRWKDKQCQRPTETGSKGGKRLGGLWWEEGSHPAACGAETGRLRELSLYGLNTLVKMGRDAAFWDGGALGWAGAGG